MNFGKKPNYKTGIFKNPKKYCGVKPVRYRSGLEYDFIIKIELTPAVVKWDYENFRIPYTLKEKVNGKFIEVRHTYLPDFTLYMKDGTVYVIEIKPKAFTPLNLKDIKRNPVIYKNSCKWRIAIIWCKRRGYKFRVFNEQHVKTRMFG